MIQRGKVEYFQNRKGMIREKNLHSILPVIFWTFRHGIGKTVVGNFRYRYGYRL